MPSGSLSIEQVLTLLAATPLRLAVLIGSLGPADSTPWLGASPVMLSVALAIRKKLC
jgi:hypothetical protein